MVVVTGPVGRFDISATGELGGLGSSNEGSIIDSERDAGCAEGMRGRA